MSKNYTFPLLLLVLGSLALGICGCGKISSTAPETEGLSTPAIQSPESGLPAEVLWPKMMMECDTVYVEAQIYEDTWNLVDLNLPGWYQWFIVPEDAIDNDTTITIAIVRYTYWDENDEQWSYMAEFDFGPDGLAFGDDDDDDKDSATLLIDAIWLDLEQGESVVLRYYNESTALWEQIATTKVKRRKIKFHIQHFSRYAISS